MTSLIDTQKNTRLGIPDRVLMPLDGGSRLGHCFFATRKRSNNPLFFIPRQVRRTPPVAVGASCRRREEKHGRSWKAWNRLEPANGGVLTITPTETGKLFKQHFYRTDVTATSATSPITRDGKGGAGRIGPPERAPDRAQSALARGPVTLWVRGSTVRYCGRRK